MKLMLGIAVAVGFIAAVAAGEVGEIAWPAGLAGIALAGWIVRRVKRTP